MQRYSKVECIPRRGGCAPPSFKDGGKMAERKFKIEYRISEGRSPKIVGTIPYYSESVDLGGFIEALKPGAFAESLRNKDRILSFWQHDVAKVLGSTEAGTMELEDSPSALKFTIYPPKTTWGLDAIESIKRGDVTGASFGFKMIKESWQSKGDKNFRLLEEAQLTEISPVSWPAYQDTKIQIRRIDMKNIQEIYDKRTRLVAAEREIIDRADNEHRQLTAEEKVQHDRMDAEFRECSKAISGHRSDDDRKAALTEKEAFLESPQGPVIKPDPSWDDETRDLTQRFENRMTGVIGDKTEYRYNEQGVSERDIYNRYLRYGNTGITPEEFRTLQVDIGGSGGFLVTPKEVANEILTGIDNKLWMRDLATTVRLEKAESLGIPEVDTDFGDPTWTGEVQESDLDDELKFGRRDLFPHPLRRGIKVSNKLLRLSEVNPEYFVNQRMIYKISAVMENAYLNGSGSNEPLGIFTVLAAGIGTDRDISAGNTTTTIKFDGLKNAIGHLKAGYRANAAFLFHRDLETSLSKMKNGSGDYIWKDAQVRGGRPMLLGYPCHLSEYAPNTFSAGNYLGVFGDFSKYWIVDSLKIEIQRLIEKYALADQTAFLIRCESDGMPCVSEAFVRLKLGS